MRRRSVWLIALGMWALAAPGVPAQAVRVSYSATEANNQHKLYAFRGQIYVTYTTQSVAVPQVRVDVSSSGARWQTLGQVSRGTGPSTLSTLVVDRAGLVHVAWTQFDGPIGRVYYSSYNRRWTEPLVLSPAATYAGYPSMDVDSRGRLHLVWYGIRPASAGVSTGHGAIYEIFYVVRDRRWTTPVRISPGIQDSINPSLAVDTKNRVHVAWFQSDGRAYQVVYRLREISGAWAEPVRITTGAEPSTNLALAVDAGGRAHIVYQHGGGIEYTRQTAAGWTTPIRLSREGRNPIIGIWRAGVFVLWQGSDGVIRMRVLAARWGMSRSLGAGSLPNAAPWRPTQDSRPYAVWTAAEGFRVTNLAGLLTQR